MSAAYYNEIEPYAAAWLRNLIAAGHIAPGEVDERSIAEVAPDDLRAFTQCHFFAGIGVWSHALRLAGWADERPVWTGSCPCQPFSAAGQQRGFDDERHLWPEFHRLVAQCRPPAVFGEQTAGAAADPWIDLVQHDLEALGYAVAAVPLPAACIGAPHIRDRLWWVADADLGTGQQGRALDGRRHPRGDAVEGAGLGRDGGARLLADADRAGPLAGQRDDQAARHGLPAAADREPGGVADAGGARRREDTRGASRDEAPHGREGRDGRRADSDHVAGRDGADHAAGPLHGFWRDADWLLCRDGKWRPVMPASFPLVDGAAFRLGSGSPLEGKSRVGMLRAAGNAIVAPLAAEFIAAVMDCRP